MATNDTNDTENNAGGKSTRGFGSMDEDKQREIASRGGKAAHEKGTAHEFTSDEAKLAGQKGGQARQNNASNPEEKADTGIGGDLLDDFDR